MSVNLGNPNMPQNVAGPLAPSPSSNGQQTSEARTYPAIFDSVVNQSSRTEEKTRAPIDRSRVGQPGVTKYTYTELKVVGRAKSAFFNQNGSMMAVTTGEDRTISFWNTSTDRASRLQMIVAHPSEVTSAAFSPNGKVMVTTSSCGQIKIWDVSTGGHLQQVSDGHMVNIGAPTFGPYGSKNKRQYPASITSAAFSPNGTMMLSTGSNGTIRIWRVNPYTGAIYDPVDLIRPKDQVSSADRNSPDNSKIVSAHKERVNSAVFSPDSSKIVSGSKDGTIKIWDASKRALLHTLENTDKVTSVAFSPDGTKIISTSKNGTIKIWDATTGELLQTITAGEKVTSAVFSPGGTKIISTSNEQTIKIWNASKGNLIETITSPKKVNSAAYSPDGTKIVSTCEDGAIQYWTPLKSEMRITASRIFKAIFTTLCPFDLLGIYL